MMMSSMLQSYQGPSDQSLRNNAVEGYSQVSRIGESGEFLLQHTPSLYVADDLNPPRFVQ
jgi:hypothetical protein